MFLNTIFEKDLTFTTQSVEEKLCDSELNVQMSYLYS